MKTAYLIGGMCAIVLLVGASMYLGKNEPQITKETSRIVLYKEYGFITWKNKDDAEYKRVESDETELPNNVYVKTVEGRGYVILPDNSSIALDVNTEVLINYEDKGTSILQMLGSTYHRVESLIAGKTYEVRTPNTLATVRGTKLLVTYDEKKKSSTIDVTESIVEVSDTENGTSSLREVSEGGTAIVGTGTTTGRLTLEVKRSSDIKEKNSWLEEHKAIDKLIGQGENKREALKEIIDSLKEIKSEDKTGESRLNDVLEALKKMEKEDLNKEGQDDQTIDIKETEEVIKKEESKIPPPVKVEEKKEEIKVEVKQELPPVGKKIGEEEFFDKFNTLFINNFYLDDKETACNSKTPDDKVKAVIQYAYESGYPFTSKTLLSFAQAIDSYCKAKDPSIKAKLQARFDEEFPFNE